MIRSKRVAPGLDDKIQFHGIFNDYCIYKWISLTNDSRYLDAAKGCISFIENNLFSGDKLLRTYKNKTAKIDGYLEDYSYFVNCLLDVFEIEPDPKYLKLALKLGYHLMEHFWDSENNSFFMTSDNHEKLIIRPKSNYDLSLPSGNSVSAFVMLNFSFFSRTTILRNFHKIMESQAQMAAENPFDLTFTKYDFNLFRKPVEITIINTENFNYVNQFFLNIYQIQLLSLCKI